MKCRSSRRRLWTVRLLPHTNSVCMCVCAVVSDPCLVYSELRKLRESAEGLALSDLTLSGSDGGEIKAHK